MVESEIKKIKSILILDDETDQARALSHRLSGMGYQTTVTFNGIDALEKARKNLPDIALLDIELKGQSMKGTDIGKKLYEMDDSIIIIFITAYPSDENFQKALNSKPFDFITKPYSMRTINRQIELAINKVLEREKEMAKNEELPRCLRILCFPEFLLVNNGYEGHSQWNIKDIVYLEADNVWTTLFTATKKNVLSMGLGKLEDKLVPEYPSLVRVHNSYLINLDQIETINATPKSGGTLTMKNEMVIKVSRGYAPNFWKTYLDYFGNPPT